MVEFNLPRSVLYAHGSALQPVVITVVRGREREVAEYIQSVGGVVRRVSTLAGIIVADVPAEVLARWVRDPSVLDRLGVISVSYEYPLKAMPFFRG